MLQPIKLYSILTLATPAKDHYFPLVPTQLPKMPQIHTIRIIGLYDGVPLQLFKAIYSAPGLQSLDIIDCPYAHVGLYDASTAPIIVPMRKFAYRTRRISHRRTLYGHLVRGPEAIRELQLEATSLWRMLVQMNLTLETLMIPGETAQFELMADLLWPSLREFTLYGLPPVTDVSITSVLSRMPLLSTLHLEFFQLPECPRFLVCPPGSNDLFPPNLESFTLTWPSPDDQVFSKLSAALTHLSLRDSPRMHSLFPFPRETGGSWIPILTGHELLPLLQAFETKGLKTLEILYYGGVGERDMLSFISTSSPSLYKLELHRFRPDRWTRDDEDVSIVCIVNQYPGPSNLSYQDTIGETLSACKSLRILRVNLDFHEEFQFTPYNKKNLPFDETAKALAERISTLEEIALFYADTVDYSRWSTYFVTRNDSGVTLLHVGYME